jgi:NADPH-dependent 2,4-dienoyl-CoA reductase/sulfur reductase-like enzyme
VTDESEQVGLEDRPGRGVRAKDGTEECARSVEVGREAIADLGGVVVDRADGDEMAGDIAGEVRQCISCNQLCWGRRSRDYFISCLVNPSAGREFEWGGDVGERATESKSIVVVGGGPAGLEAARVAAERGHAVRLVEASSELGGQLRLAGLQPTRYQIVELIEWYGRELDRLGVEVELGRTATAAWVSGLGADEVVIAIGAASARAGFQRAVPMVARLDGIDAGGVLAVHDVLEPGAPALRGRVLLLDDVGDWRGIGTAMHLQEAGASVTVVTSAAVVGGGLFHSAADVPARKRFATAGGMMQPFTVVDEWLGDRARLRSTLTGAIEEVAFDHLVIAETAVPRSSLSLELTEAGIAHHTIGDCVAARRASLAIYEAKSLALRL